MISNYILAEMKVALHIVVVILIIHDLKLYNVSIFNMCSICCCSSDKQCPILMDFLRSGIHFASVDITNDKIKMRRTWGLEIPSACHIDLQRIFRLDRDKTGMADMAVAVIEEDDYADMKT